MKIITGYPIAPSDEYYTLEAEYRPYMGVGRGPGVPQDLPSIGVLRVDVQHAQPPTAEKLAYRGAVWVYVGHYPALRPKAGRPQIAHGTPLLDEQREEGIVPAAVYDAAVCALAAYRRHVWRTKG